MKKKPKLVCAICPGQDGIFSSLIQQRAHHHEQHEAASNPRCAVFGCTDLKSHSMASRHPRFCSKCSPPTTFPLSQLHYSIRIYLMNPENPIHHREAACVCPLHPETIFTSHADLRDHIIECHPDVCPQCHARPGTPRKLTNHEKTCQYCPICVVHTSGKGTLSKHLAAEHNLHYKGLYIRFSPYASET